MYDIDNQLTDVSSTNSFGIDSRLFGKLLTYTKSNNVWELNLGGVLVLHVPMKNSKCFISLFAHDQLKKACFIKWTRSRTWTFRKTGFRTFRKTGSYANVHSMSQRLTYGKFERADFKYDNNFF